jgi:hypothetical protein
MVLLIAYCYALIIVLSKQSINKTENDPINHIKAMEKTLIDNMLGFAVNYS